MIVKNVLFKILNDAAKKNTTRWHEIHAILYMYIVYHVSHRRHIYPPKCIHSCCVGIAIENEYNVYTVDV